MKVPRSEVFDVYPCYRKAYDAKDAIDSLKWLVAATVYLPPNGRCAQYRLACIGCRVGSHSTLSSVKPSKACSQTARASTVSAYRITLPSIRCSPTTKPQGLNSTASTRSTHPSTGSTLSGVAPAANSSSETKLVTPLTSATPISLLTVRSTASQSATCLAL